MQVSVESIGKLERRMQVQVPAERVSKEIAARLKELSRTARLKGFRPGKAPITVIRQQFGQQVHREVIGELHAVELRRGGHAESAVAGRQPAHRAAPRSPRARTSLMSRPSRFSPRSRCSRSGALAVERVTAEVTESDVDAMIERLRKQQMKYSRGTRGPRPTATRSRWILTGSIDGVAVRRRQGRERRHRARRGTHAAAARAGPGRRRGRREPRNRRRFSRRLPRDRARGQARDVQGRREDRRGAGAAGARRGVLRRVRRDRGRRRASCARTCAANMRRELEQNLRNRNKAAGDGQALPGEPHRRAERAARVADPGHADRGHAPHRRQGRLAGAAARAAWSSRRGAASRSGC